MNERTTIHNNARACAYIDVALLEQALTDFTARLTVQTSVTHVPQYVWDHMEKLHKICRRMKERLREEEREKP